MKDTDECLAKSARLVSHADGVVASMKAAKRCEDLIFQATRDGRPADKKRKQVSIDPNKLVQQIKNDQANELVR